MTFKPISRIILQAADGSEFYSVAWDPTTAISLSAMSGVLTAARGGNSFAFGPSDATAMPPPAAPPGSLAVVEAGPGTAYPTLTLALVAMKPGGTINLRPGSYNFAQGCADIKAMHGNPTIAALQYGTVTGDGQQFNAYGTDGKPRGIWQKALIHVSDPITVTIKGIAFVNCGDPSVPDALAALYSEGGANLVVEDCSFDNCDDGIFGQGSAGSYTGRRNSFGKTSSNGRNQPGYSHDVYWNGASATETDCMHYGCVSGHSFKSRAKTTTLTGGLYTSIGGGRAIDFPNGGTLNLSNVSVWQKAGSELNVLGFGNENALNGPPVVTWTGGSLAITRNPAGLMMQNGGTLTATGVVQSFENGGNITLIGSGVVTGLLMQAGPGTLAAAVAPPTGSTSSYDLSQMTLVQDYRFGKTRTDGNIRSKTDLDLAASPRYIYGDYKQTAGSTGDGCDGLYGNYWSRHIDTPEGDPASVHVFTPNSLILRGRNNPNPPAGVVAGRDGGGILSGIARFWAPIVPNKSFIRVRAKMPKGKYGWATIWLDPGQESYAPLNGPRGAVLLPLGWPPEDDVQDGFGYDNVMPGTLLRPGEPTQNNDGAFGRKVIWEDAAWASNPGYDYRRPGAADGWLAADFHEYALDWTNGVLTYFCDGVPYTQRTLAWNSPANACAHLIIGMQVVATFNPNPYPLGVPDQGGVPNGWDYEISDVQVYQRQAGVAPNPGKLSPAPGVTPVTTAWAKLPPKPPSPAVLSSTL